MASDGWAKKLHCVLLVAIVGWTNLGANAAQTTTCPGPSNLSVQKLAVNTADLRWDVTKYISNPIHCVCNDRNDVTEYCNESVVPKTCIKSLGGYVRQVPSLSVYTNYTFCVQTQCADSNYSLPVCTKYTTSPAAPSAPYQIFADKQSPSSLDISWRFPTVLNGPLDGYKIRWCYAPQCTSFTEEHLEGANKSRSYRITGLEPYKEYQVYVSAYNVDNGKYLYGAEASVKDFTLPTYPSSPSMTFTKVSTSQVNVLISVPKYPNGPITGYVLRWCPKRRCYGSNVGEREILQSNAGTQAVTGLKFWTEYVFSVSAFNLLPTDNARIYSDVVNDSVITMPFSPAGPQPFKVVALSATSVKLSWEAPVNPDVTPSHYRLFWCTKDNRFCFNADVGNVREAVISPLAPWTTYTFMIKALVQFTGPWLNSQVSTVTGRTWAAEPSRPTSLLVTKQQATTVDVSWQMPRDPVGPLDGFRIRICPELGTCPPMGLISRYKTLNSKTLTHSFYGLEAYTNYQVQVRAFNSLPNGETAEGDVAVVAVTTAPSSPSQPTRLQVKALNSSALGVTWRPPSHPNGPVKGYQVTWWKTGGTSTDDIEDRLNNKTVFLPGEASSFTITHLEAYKTYAVQVARINGDRNSTWDGAAAHAEGITDPEPCPPPTQLSATAVKVNATSSKAVINWAPPNGTFDPPIQGYYVHICKIEVNRGILAEGKCQYSNTSESVFTFTFEGLENLADYGVVVRAYVLHDGRYIEGNEATEFVATEAPPIPTVANLNYTASNGSAVTLSWSRVTGLEQYSVLYNVALYLTEDDTLIFSQNVNGTDVSFDALKPWTQYTVRVSACLPRSTKLQCGDPGVLRFETPPTGPSKVTELEVSVVNSTSLKLKWEAPSDTNGPLSGYQLTWWKTSENPSLDVQERLNNKTVLLSHDARSFLLVELDTYTTYAIEVVAINVVGSTTWKGLAARVKRTTDPSPSPQPSDLSIERINVHFSSCDISLRWGPPNGTLDAPIQGYLVRLCQAQNETKCLTQNTTEKEFSITFEGVNTFTEYVAEVRAYIRHKTRIIVGEAAFTSITIDSGTIPTVDNVNVAAINQSFVRVSWNEVNGLRDVRYAYNVRVYLVSNQTMIRQDYVEDAEWVSSDLPQRSNYTITVAVCILRGHGEQCGEATATEFTSSGVDHKELIGIQASVVNSTAIQVTWNSPKDPTGKVEDYRITWWKTGETSVSGTGVMVPEDTETFIISELDSYESYIIQITSTNGDVLGVVSGVKTDPSPSPRPPGLVLKTMEVGVLSAKVVVGWDAPSVVKGPEVGGYIVVICPTEDNETALDESSCQTKNVSAENTTVDFEDLEKLADYVVKVRAYVTYEGRLIEGESSTAVMSTSPSSIPTVRNLELTVSNSNTVRVTWGEPIGLEHYRVVYNVRVYLTGSEKAIVQLDVNETETTLTELAHLTNYTVRVFVCLVRTAKRQCGEPGSNDIQTLADPREPRNVRVHVINSTSLSVTWNAPSSSSGPEEGYQITWWRTGAISDDTTQSLNGTTFVTADSGVFIITHLEPYEHYVVQVARGNGDQSGAWEERGVRVAGLTDPEPSPQPSGLTFQAISSSSETSTVAVTWNPAHQTSGPPLQGYVVTICPVQDDSERSLESGCRSRNTSAAELTAVFEDLKKFTDYDVEIWAYVEHDGRIIKGDVATKTLSTDPPDIPAVDDLNLSLSNQSVAHVTWSRPAGLEEYRVVYNVKVFLKTSGEKVFEVIVNETQVTFSNLTYRTDFTVQVVVCIVRTARRSCGGSGSVDFQTSDDPREPRNVRVHVINSTSMTVTWDTPGPSDDPKEGYQITWWHAGTTSGDTTQSPNGTTLVAADSGVFIITDLEPYEHYVVQVARGNGDQSSAWEERGVRVAGLTDPEPSPQPSGLTFQAISASSKTSTVAVTWNPAHQTSGPPIQGYVVTICPVQDDSERSPESGCSSRNTSAAELTAVFEDLKKFTDYDVEIWAYVEHDGRIIKGDVATKTLSTDPPDIPAVDNLNLSLSNQSVAHVTWSRPAGLEEYRVVYNVKVFLKTSGEEVFEITVNETQVALSNLTFWTDFTVRVVVCIVRIGRRSCGGSDSFNFQTQGDPREPSNIRVTVINSTSLSVSWDKPSLSDESMEGYQVTWWKASDHSNITDQDNKTTFVSADANTFIITDLEPYQRYIVQVARAHSSASETGVTTAGHSEGTTDPSPNPPPGALSLHSTGTLFGSSNVTVTWVPPPDTHGPPVQGYVVVICRTDEEVPNQETSNCKSTNTTATSLTLQGLSTFADYNVEIRAYVVHNGRIIEGTPNRAKVSTDPDFVPTITNVTLDTSNGTFVHATWQKPAGLEGFQVVFNVTVYETTDGGIVLLQDVNKSETYLTGLKQGGNYTVAVSTCLVRPTRRRCGEASSTVFQTTRAGATLTSFEAKALNSTALLVNWQPAGDQDAPSGGYRITWWNSKNDTEQRTFVGTVTVPGDATNFTITGLTPFETYSIEIANINGQGSDAWETIAGKAEAMTDPAPYPKPWRVTVKPTRLNTTTSRAVISWNPPNGTFDPPMQGFILRVCRFANKTDIDESSCTTSTTSSNDTTITIEALDNFGEYLVEIRAYVEHDDRIVRGRRGLALFSTEAPPIGTVESLGFRDLAATSVYVSWKEPADLERFDVSYNVTLYAPAFMEEERRRWANGTGIVLSSLEPWTNYTVGVSACLVGTTRTQCGNSSHVEFSTPPSAPGIPRNLEVTTTENRRTLIWQAPLHSNGPLSGYEVSVRCSLGNTNVNSSTYNIDSTVRSFALSDAEPRASCQVTVRAYNIYRDEDDWLYGPAARLKYTQPVPEGIVTPQPN
ncbi:protein sidekick-2 [Ixodes scapularis]|uniref:protein sidekick-2 n=1 Tax=Ixodes scapularis TaxID=6945 RepID=UPI001C38CCAB|nr:protein sidekick-2 [Ixodes scapularis]